MLNLLRIKFALFAFLLITWIIFTFRDVIPSITLLHDSSSSVKNWISHQEDEIPHSSNQNDINLSEICSLTNWTPGLWLQCHSYAGSNHTAIAGGLNNARNRIQTCIRLAIDAGSGLIIPPIATQRHADKPAEFSDEEECLDSFFDVEYMVSELKSQCPQLKLRFCGNTKGIDRVLETDKRHYSGERYHSGTFENTVHSILRESGIESITDKKPVAISFGDSYISWNYTASFEKFTIQKSLFRLLKFNKELLSFSDQILKMPELKSGFIGVHLRGEPDWPQDWGSLHEQISFYTSEIERINSQPLSRDMRTIYVSSGSKTTTSSFRSQLEEKGYIVYDKWMLLSSSPSLLRRLDEMQFDQKAVLEYHVLVAAEYWMGVLMSTMSELIAFARTVDSEEDFQEVVREGSFRGNGGVSLWRDVPALKGNEFTKLLVVNAGPLGLDNLDCFP